MDSVLPILLLIVMLDAAVVKRIVDLVEIPPKIVANVHKTKTLQAKVTSWGRGWNKQ